jgi:YidC/Oxa1 family membrane protein insertase
LLRPLSEVLNIAGEVWPTTAALMYVIEYFHIAQNMEWWVGDDKP